MLSRIALRLAAVEALNPAATVAAGPWPTLAGKNVWEERIDLISQSESPEDISALLDGLENQPIIVVYTEDHHSLPYGQTKYPPDENVCTLAIEISLGAQGIVRIVGPSGAEIELGAIDAPFTDRQHAAVLDMLEAQIRYILDRRNLAPSALLFRKVAGEIRSIHSDPQRAGDRTLRLALRTLKFHVKIGQDQWPPPGSAAATGLAALPEPLRTVALGLPAGSDGARLCADLAAMVPTPAGLDAPIEGVSILLGLAGRMPAHAADADVVASVPPAASATPQP